MSGILTKMAANTFPVLRRDDSVFQERCGITVVDHYRWLEDPDSEETKQFVDAQNAISEPYLKDCPARGKFYSRSVNL